MEPGDSDSDCSTVSEHGRNDLASRTNRQNTVAQPNDLTFRPDIAGPSTRQDMPGLNTIAYMPGLITRQDKPVPSTRQDIPGPITRKVRPRESIQQDKPITRLNTQVLTELPKKPRLSPRQAESNSVGTPAQMSRPDLPEPISFLNTQPAISHIGETELVSTTGEHESVNMATTFLNSDDISSFFKIIEAEFTSNTDGLQAAELPRESDRSGRSSNNNQDILIVDDDSTDQYLLSPQPSTSSSGPRVKASVSNSIERPVADLPVEENIQLPNLSNQSDEPQINENIIGHLECPVCAKYIVPPIFQCLRGHLMCYICRYKSSSCPTCHDHFSENRNLAMEQVAEIALFPCRNSNVGCSKTVKMKELKSHENSCPLRSFKCLLPQCEWSGFHQEIIPHLHADHASYIDNPAIKIVDIRKNNDMLMQKRSEYAILRKRIPFSLDLVLLLEDLSIPVSYNWLVYTENEVFRINFSLIIDTVMPHLFGCVQYIGPERNTKNYKYQIKSTKPREFMEFCFTTFTVSDRRPCSRYYESYDAFHLGGEELKHWIDGSPFKRSLNVEVCIM